MIIEVWDILDSLFMTIITLATVGYQEVHHLSRAGHIFTMLLIISGASFFLYVAGAAVKFIVEGRIRTVLGRRILDNRINKLKNHYIICGYGRIGRVLCKKLAKEPMDIVVLEENTELIPVMDEDGILYVHGNATEEPELIKAGIKHAKGLIAALSSDPDNVFLVLTARQLNQDLFIMARSCHDSSKAKLKAAGADKVESPYDMGAASMAQRIIRPAVTNFLDLALAHSHEDIQMEEIPVSPSSNLLNVMLKDSGIRQQFDLIIIAIKKSDDSMIFNPSFETTIEVGDTVIAVGEKENLQKFENVLNP